MHQLLDATTVGRPLRVRMPAGPPVGAGPAQATCVDLRPELAQDGGEQGECRSENGDDGEHDAQGHGAEGGARHQQDGGERHQHGHSGERDRFSGSAHGFGDGFDRGAPVARLGSSMVER